MSQSATTLLIPEGKLFLPSPIVGKHEEDSDYTRCVFLSDVYEANQPLSSCFTVIIYRPEGLVVFVLLASASADRLVYRVTAPPGPPGGHEVPETNPQRNLPLFSHPAIYSLLTRAHRHAAMKTKYPPLCSTPFTVALLRQMDSLGL